MDRMVAETAARVFSGRSEDPAALWAALEETGLTAAATPEAMGGAGFGAEEVWGLMRLSGAHAAPVPFAETLLAARLLAAAGSEPPAGRMTLAAGGTIREGRVTASLKAVPWGAAAERVLLLAEGETGPVLALMEIPDAAATPAPGIGEDAAADLVFDADLPEAAAPAPNWLTPLAFRAELALARAAQMAGAMEASLELTLAHTSVREQFGRPLAKFQAIQHMLAEMAGEAAAAGAAVEAAAESAAAGGPVDWRAAAVAKIRAGEAAERVSAHAHQAHGAIGYTYEYDLRKFSRRLWRWRDEAGDETEWAVALATAADEEGTPLSEWIIGPVQGLGVNV
ncbi:MAG: acyl-CoA dehydrogenase family protein [Paracoccaceae bacterium]